MNELSTAKVVIGNGCHATLAMIADAYISLSKLYAIKPGLVRIVNYISTAYVNRTSVGFAFVCVSMSILWFTSEINML
jgi:hypothetical protein